MYQDDAQLVGLDRWGLEMFLPIDRRNATFAELLRRGHADRIHVSQDRTATIDWFSDEAAQGLMDAGMIRNWTMTLVFDEVLPALREEGAFADEHFEQIFVENPRRWLAG